ncbi:DUF4911 domain-containing protein [Desulforhopalus singaporensis]|uniref:DUF4911 domain-containing protein n=1 Tax=Desulforhopalus singaporensis TaxID=91360 RepID=A0A1H0QK72_9BACT|nr:protein of unknown function [Desulforhopalus singaporensis]
MAVLKTQYLRISKDKFHYLKFILEGYDNLAILSSFDNNGVVVLRYPDGLSRELFELLESIAVDIGPGF